MSTKTMYAVRFKDSLGGSQLCPLDRQLLRYSDAPEYLWADHRDATTAIGKYLSTVCVHRIWIEPVEVEEEPDAPVPIGTKGERVVKLEHTSFGLEELRVTFTGEYIGLPTRSKSTRVLRLWDQLEDMTGIDLSGLKEGDSIWLRVTTEVVDAPQEDDR